MTAPDLKCECGTVLADGGPVGLYCPNRECQIEQDMAAKAYKAMRDRKRLAEALAVPDDVYAYAIDVSEAFDTMMEVEMNPNGAWQVIQALAGHIAALRTIGEGKA